MDIGFQSIAALKQRIGAALLALRAFPPVYVARLSVPWKYVLRQSHFGLSGRDCPWVHSR
jgi:hypothetical protein